MSNFRFLSHPRGPDGRPAKWCWELFGCGLGSFQWHTHTKACRYGLYTNFKTNSGLVVALNIPLLGDFTFWR